MNRIAPTLTGLALVFIACTDPTTAPEVQLEAKVTPVVLLSAAKPGASIIESIIDFESLVGLPGDGRWDQNYTLFSMYSEDGYSLHNLDWATGAPLTATDAFLSPRPDAPIHWYYYEGSQALANNRNPGKTLLTKDDGGTFDVVSMDFAELRQLGGLSIRWIPFTGTKADGSTVTATFVTDEHPGFQTFTFSGFTDLVSLSWLQQRLPDDPNYAKRNLVGFLPAMQFDNIVLQFHIPPPPPPGGGGGEDPANPLIKADCMKDGWLTYGFLNQGQCVRFVETQKDSRN